MIDVDGPSAMLRRLLDALPCGALLEDDSGRIVHLNASLAAGLGVDAGAVIGHTLDALPLERRGESGSGECASYGLRGREAVRVRVTRVVLDADTGLAARLFAVETDGREAAVDPAVNPAGVAGLLRTGRPAQRLAGVPERAATLAHLEREISRSRRYTNPLSVVLVRVRTEFHAADRDALMRRSAAEIRDCIRWVDVVGRVAPSELLIVLPETGPDGATGLVEKVRARLAVPREGSGAIAANVVGGIWERGEDGAGIVRRLGRRLDARGGLS